MRVGWIAILFALTASPQLARASGFDVSRCSPTVLQASDNDLHLARDSRAPGSPVAVPRAVVKRARTVAARLVKRLPANEVKFMSCETIFGVGHRVTGLGGNDMYVLEVGLSAENFFALVLYDPKDGTATRKPPLVGAKWPENFGLEGFLMPPPFVKTTRLLAGGPEQIVFKERVHNGTVYNGVVAHFFEIGRGLELRQVFALEEAALDPLQDATYWREVRRIGPGRLRVDLSRSDNAGTGKARRLGYTVAERGRPGQPFHIVERRPEPGFHGGLTTFCQGISDDAFLRKGCDFYY